MANCDLDHEVVALLWSQGDNDPLGSLLGGMVCEGSVQFMPYRCVTCYEPTRKRCPCKTVFYCSTDCQRADRARHKTTCVKDVQEEPYDVERRRGRSAVSVVFAPERI